MSIYVAHFLTNLNCLLAKNFINIPDISSRVELENIVHSLSYTENHGGHGGT